MSPLDFDRGDYIRYLVFKEPTQKISSPFILPNGNNFYSSFLDSALLGDADSPLSSEKCVASTERGSACQYIN